MNHTNLTYVKEEDIKEPITGEDKISDLDHTVEKDIMTGLLTDKSLEEIILEGIIEVTIDVEYLIAVEGNQNHHQGQEIVEQEVIGQDQNCNKRDYDRCFKYKQFLIEVEADYIYKQVEQGRKTNPAKMQHESVLSICSSSESNGFHPDT